MKTCTKCKVEKPKTLEYFTKHPKTKDGYDTWCRECKNTQAKKDIKNQNKTLNLFN